MIDLYIHVGHAKCGSSTIQNFLYHNWATLLDNDIGIVDYELMLFNRRSKNQPPVPYFKALKAGTISEKTFLDDLTDLAKKAERKGLKKLILSAENLSTHGMPDYLSAAKELFKCHFIYYIRRQDSWIISSWKQWRMKEGLSLQDYMHLQLSKHPNTYRRVIRTWQEKLEPETMAVRYLHKECLLNGDLIQDFCQLTGLDYDTLVPVADSNKRLDNDLMHVLAQIPFVFNGRHDNRLFSMLEKEFGEELPSKHGSPLSYEDRQMIMDRYKAENQWLKVNFFADYPFDQWLEVDKNQPYTPYDPARGQLLLSGILLKLMLDINFPNGQDQ